ncbi:MAG: hypothetical protein HY318_18500, partial [Armatimonadetes bacterium]|nr:hypothetical protein [Armatimonadota bacterium]
LGKRRGALRLNVPPRSRGIIEIPLPRQRDAGSADRSVPTWPGDGLHLEFHDGRGWLVDAYHLIFPATTEKPETLPHGPNSHSNDTTPTILKEEQLLTVRGRRFAVDFDRTTGKVRSATIDGVAALLEGPTLHLLPLSDAFVREPDPKTWTLRNLQTHVERARVHVVVAGTYTGVEGQHELVIDGAGGIEVHYRFARTGPDLAVRESGLRFAVPRQCDMLRWRRRAEFSVYPEDHIGRAVGEAPAVPSHVNRRASPPRWPWSQDFTPAGSNDFRSTKRNLLSATLTYTKGSGVHIESNGKQHLRCAVEGDRIAIYVNDWYGGTNCRGFFEWQGNYGTGKVISTGTVIEGIVRLRLMAPK